MRAAAAIGILACAGCVSPYAPPPDDGATARLRVVSTHAYPTSAVVLTKECRPRINFQWDMNTERLAFLPGRGSEPKRDSIGMPMTSLPEYASFAELRIPADKPFNLAFRLAGGNVFCTVALQLTPQRGADYEATFREDGQNCVMRIARLAPQGSEGRALAVPVPGDLQRIPACP